LHGFPHPRGERNGHYLDGVPCSTHTLDHAATIDYDGSGRARFDGTPRLEERLYFGQSILTGSAGPVDLREKAMLGGCYEVNNLFLP
jgi:hypothetical protein